MELLQGCGPSDATQKSGSIVNIASAVAVAGQPGYPHHIATRALDSDAELELLGSAFLASTMGSAWPHSIRCIMLVFIDFYLVTGSECTVDSFQCRL